MQTCSHYSQATNILEAVVELIVQFELNMDLLQKSTNLVERQRKRKEKLMKEDENCNRIDEAVNYFLKSNNVGPDDLANQQMYLKANQKQLLSLSQWPSFLPRELVHVEILHAISPKELFVLKKCDKIMVDKFHRRIAEDYSNNKHQLVYCLKVGTICAAKTSKGWQRCRILKLHGKNTCDVLLIDIGMKERVKWDDLRLLNDKWFQTKPFAIRCSLVSMISANSIDRVTMLKQQEFTRILQAKTDFYVVCNRPDVVSSDIFLYYKFENQFRCVNAIFPSDTMSDNSSIDETEMSTKIGHRTPSSGEHFSLKDSLIQRSEENQLQIKEMEHENNEPKNHIDQNGNHTNNKNVNEQEQEPRNPAPSIDKLVSKPEPIIVKHIDGIDGIYICFKKYLTGVKRLRFQVQNCVQQTPDTYQRSWKVGEYCLVFDLFDGISEWLRGRIVSIIDSETYEIYLRDDGKTIESSAYNLKPIDEELKKVRDFTWKMKLSYIQMEKSCPKNTFNELLCDIISGYDEIAISALRKSNGIILWGIKRLVGALLPERYEYVNINEELVKHNVATTAVEFGDINDAINNLVNKEIIELDDSDDDQTDQNQYKVTDRKNEAKRWLPSQPIAKREFVVFPQYFTQQKMYVSVLEASRKTTAEEIRQILIKKGKAKELEKRDSVEWKKDDACFAPFGNERHYYRATLRRVNFAKNTCVVRFIDYGNCETCSLDVLRKANMFGDIPVLARLYALDNIKAPNEYEEWPEYVRDFCTNTVVDKQCNLIVTEATQESKSTDDPETCILEIFTKDKDLGNALVKRQYAERIH